MYTLEILTEERPEGHVLYWWELRLVTYHDEDDEEVVVVESRRFPSAAEAEADIRAFRRGVARARVNSPACDPGPSSVSFHRVPGVVSLPVTIPSRRGAQHSIDGRHRHDLPSTGPIELPAREEPRAEAIPAELDDPADSSEFFEAT
jgi:hypothetical protein